MSPVEARIKSNILEVSCKSTAKDTEKHALYMSNLENDSPLTKLIELKDTHSKAERSAFREADLLPSLCISTSSNKRNNIQSG